MDAKDVEQVTGWKAAVAEVMSIAAMLANPMGIAIVLNIIVTQAIELYDHLLPRWLLKPGTTEISLGAAAILAFVLQPFIFAAVCFFAAWPVRGEMFVQGLVGGALGSVVGAVGSYYGLSLDGLAERIKARQAASPPST